MRGVGLERAEIDLVGAELEADDRVVAVDQIAVGVLLKTNVSNPALAWSWSAPLSPVFMSVPLSAWIRSP